VARFILMLTRDDRTLPNAASVCADLGDLGLQHVGFKDVGLTQEALPDLVRAIHDLGAEAAIELVGLEPAGEARWARRASDAGVDRVLGGAHAEVVSHALADTPVRYFPFAGEVQGHPTRLRGSMEDVVDGARRLAELGVEGIDLLAYRFDGDAPMLAAAVAGVTGLPVVAAGGICSDEQIYALTRAGVWGFTMGTAVFDGAYRPEARSVRERVALALESAQQARTHASTRERGGGYLA